MNKIFLDLMPFNELVNSKRNSFFYSKIVTLLLFILCFLLFLNLIIGTILLIRKIKESFITKGFKVYYIISIIIFIILTVLFIISASKPEIEEYSYVNKYENIEIVDENGNIIE